MFTAYLLNAVSLWPDEVCTMVLPIKHKKKNMLVRVLKSAWSYTVVETS